MSIIGPDAYDGWWEKGYIPAKYRERVKHAVKRALRNKSKYLEVDAITEIPWQLIAVLMELEGGSSLENHIANGDPLEDYTTHDPAGQPANLTPPWTWQEAAVEELKEIHQPPDGAWTLRAILEAAERFNGTGPRSKGKRSAYLVSSSALEQRGKYVADHVWDPDAVSDQVGALAMLHGLEDAGEQLPSW